MTKFVTRLHIIPFRQADLVKKERDRLDLQHVLWIITVDGELSIAPIEEPKHVLDIATGTGIWAMDFAEQVWPPSSTPL
jgi:methylase of polypeptide subunit release factors